MNTQKKWKTVFLFVRYFLMESIGMVVSFFFYLSLFGNNRFLQIKSPHFPTFEMMDVVFVCIYTFIATIIVTKRINGSGKQKYVLLVIIFTIFIISNVILSAISAMVITGGSL